jgi:hypothetical protein
MPSAASHDCVRLPEVTAVLERCGRPAGLGGQRVGELPRGMLQSTAPSQCLDIGPEDFLSGYRQRLVKMTAEMNRRHPATNRRSGRDQLARHRHEDRGIEAGVQDRRRTDQAPVRCEPE